MAKAALFKTKRGNHAVIGSNGRRYNFQGSPVGRCWVTDKASIEELTKFAETGEAGIYIDPAEPEVDTEATSPMEALRRQIIRDFLIEQSKLKPASEYAAGAGEFARGVSGTDESVLMGNQLAGQKAQAALIGEAGPDKASPALSKLQDTLAKSGK